MISTKIRFDSKKVTTQLTDKTTEMVRLISQDLFNTIKGKTPVRSGRAKKGWRLKKQNDTAYKVSNSVSYISLLDAGKSKQAPRGMTRPALREVLAKSRTRRK
tara:strand:+ start:1043 stop:1351 length:309 start_codon:yes stop_codon:yes gene_type:complete